MISRPPVTRSGAQRAARHELAKAIYHRNDKPLVERALDWVGRQIDRLLRHAGGHGQGGDLGVLAVVVVLAAIVVLVIWRVGIPRRAAATGALLAGDRATTAADHRRRSDQAADREDWNTAVVERMRAIARQLEESGVLDPRAGRTASELAEEAGAQLPAVASDIRMGARSFNDVAYGGMTATTEMLATLVRIDDTVRASAGRQVVVR